MAEQDKFEAMEIKTRKQLEEAEKAKKKKKRNYIVGFSLLGVGIAALVTTYVLASQIWLVDLAMLPYCEYSYSSNGDATTATLRKVRPTKDKDVPIHFTVPSKVNGLTITKIADSAFSECRNVVSISMSDYVTDIGSKAFFGCDDLETINFSKNITHLGNDAFLDTPFLKNLPKDGLSVVSQILFNVGPNYLEEGSILLASKDSVVPEKYANCHKFYLDESEGNKLSGWSEGLFENNDNIVYAEIPSYLDTVPANSFNGCDNLEAVKFIGETKVIGKSAFANTPNLKEVILSDDVTTIDDFAFEASGIDHLNVTDNVIKVGAGIFKGCGNITEFIWPNQLTSIPESTFEGCDKLASFTYNSDVVNSLGRNAFANTALTSFKFPKNISSVPIGVFNGAKQLTSVSMFESETYFDKEGIKYVNGISSIGFDAFKDTNLKEIRLYDKSGTLITPENEVRLPNSVLSMSSRSDSGLNFGGEENGTAITSFTFPQNLLSTSRGMFKNAKNLSTLNFETHHAGGKTVGLSTIAIETFIGCDSIVEFGETINKLPSSIETISAYAFANMANLKKVIFPENDLLTVLEANLFENDKSLDTVKFNEAMYVFKEYAFHNNFSAEFRKNGIVIPFNKIDESSGLSLLDISHRAFYNMVEGVREEIKDDEGNIIDYGKVIKTLPENEKFPIYLELHKDQLDEQKVLFPEFISEDCDKTDPNNVRENASGWYDMATCHVYYGDEWHYDAAGKPVLNAKEGE